LPVAEQAEVATLEPFDLVLGIGVLHHLDDATARHFMAVAQAALKPRRAYLHARPLLRARPEPDRAFPHIA
jgi:2-polyprenyl-3-methyl-5-hydroxy-6-metoxy-1,4-benzoquinol methylase